MKEKEVRFTTDARLIEKVRHFNTPPTWWIYILVFAVIFSGCAAVGPDYRPPVIEIPANWHTNDDPAQIPSKELVQQWWALFDDPLLDDLIQTAKQNNRDLMAAVARVEEARALLGFSKGAYLPELDAQGSATRQETSDNGLSPGVDDTL